jgi:hypothetical protein
MKRNIFIGLFCFVFIVLSSAQIGVYVVNEDFLGGSISPTKIENTYSIIIRKSTFSTGEIKYSVIFTKPLSKIYQRAELSSDDYLMLIDSINAMMNAPTSNAVIIERRFEAGKFLFSYTNAGDKNWIMNLNGLDNYYFTSPSEFLPEFMKIKSRLLELQNKQ